MCKRTQAGCKRQVVSFKDPGMQKQERRSANLSALA